MILTVALISNQFWGPEGNFLPIVIWAMMFASIMANGTVFHWLLDNKAMHWLGTVSYSTYIVHMPILIAVKQNIMMNEGLMQSLGLGGIERGTADYLLLMIAIAWPIVLAMSVFSYYIIETPGIRLGKAIASKLTGKPKSSFPQIQAPA